MERAERTELRIRRQANDMECGACAAFFFVAYGANAGETPANRAEPCACRAKDFLDCVAVKE